jgi:hypothetical protein
MPRGEALPSEIQIVTVKTRDAAIELLGRFFREEEFSWCHAQGCSAVSVTITTAGERRHGLGQFYARLGFAQSGRISASAALDA